MRFVRENRQMANKNLYREDVLQMLFADSDSEGEYLPFGNDDRPSNDRASPGTSLPLNGAARPLPVHLCRAMVPSALLPVHP